MLNKIFGAVKRFFRFFIEKPGARLDWAWSVDAPNSSYKKSSINDSASSRKFQGFGPKGWVPAQIDYYGPAMKQDDGTQTGDDVWTTEKLLEMSNALAQSYDGTPSRKNQDWTAEKLINMSDSLAHSAMPGMDKLKKPKYD
jgi:hypothetical protein